MADLTAYPCPTCQIGYYQSDKTTYLCLHRGMLVSVPDMPVWMCDICGHEEFDRDAVAQLEALLGPPDGVPETQRNNSKIQSIDLSETPPLRRMKP
jgi:YgiT-type zinc finger domain-containing protein